MIVYRGPREAFGGGARNCGGTVAFQPNITKNSLVCTVRVPSLPGCPGSPLPETMIAWARPGPVMRAWDGPFASAGVASVIAAAALVPAARVMTAVSLRSTGAAPFVAAHCCYTAARCQVPAVGGVDPAESAGIPSLSSVIVGNRMQVAAVTGHLASRTRR